MKKWEYDRELKWHTLPVITSKPDDDIFVFCYKSAAGDYVISAMREGDIAGGEVEYEESLPKAKKFAERIAGDGSYTQYLMSA